MTTPPLPPGFVLEDQPSASGGVPPLPPGFELESDEPAALEIDIVGGRRESDPDPTEGMSTGQRLAAGFGRSIVETGRGLKQAATNAGELLALGVAGSPEARQLIRRGFDPIQQRQQAEIDEARRIDAPLLDTGAGTAGNVAGVLTQLIGPGLALRGTTAGAAFLPTTIGGNAAQGAALGAIQPTASGESRALNTATGGAAGAAGAALFAGGARGINALRNLGSGASSTDRAAVNVLNEMAADPASLAVRAPSQVPGVQRTLAEETLDPGIARLERNMRSTSNEFDAIDRANNAARVSALESFAGDEAALRQATQDRNRAALPLLGQSYLDKNVDIEPVIQQIIDKVKMTSARPSVQSALNDVLDSIRSAQINGGDVFNYYQSRKYIGDLLSGKAGSDKSYARAASKELVDIKNHLDNVLSRSSPSFDSYLKVYRQMSAPINRMQVGQRLMGRSSGGAVLDPVTGAQVLTPAQFSKASRSLDDVAAKATGFKNARASDILTSSDIATIRAIQDDLERQAFRSTAGSGGGSPTFERTALDAQLSRRAADGLAGQIPVVGPYVRDFLGVLDRSRNERIKERLAYLVANPDEARRVIASLPASGQGIVSKALAQIGGSTSAAGAIGSTAAAPQDAP